MSEYANVKEIWQKYYDQPLTDDDAGEIAYNLYFFFQVLREERQRQAMLAEGAA